MSENNIKKAGSRGFTLVELLIVIAIISILSSIILASVRVARQKAYVARIQADQNQLRSAITSLTGDTGQWPNHWSDSSCTGGIGQEIDITSAGVVGIQATDGTYSNWQGPYMTIIQDPWARNYVFNRRYTCNGQMGCAGIANGTLVTAIVSKGVDGLQSTALGSDDIITVLCR